MGGVDVSYRQFCKMQTLFQRSRAWGREMGGYLMEDGSFLKMKESYNAGVRFCDNPPEGAIAEFHTHWDKPGAARFVTDERGIVYSDKQYGHYIKCSRYHGAADFTEGIKSLVLNRYDGSYFSGEYMVESLPNSFVGPPDYVPTPYQIINPPILRYNYGYLFSIRN